MHDSVTVHMDAPPERIWELVSDVTQIGRFSPETFEAEWTDGATGPEVGAHFRGHVRRNEKGPVYWTKCKVTDCEPGQRFAFGVITGGRILNTWSYALEAKRHRHRRRPSRSSWPRPCRCVSTGLCWAGPGAAATATTCVARWNSIKAVVESQSTRGQVAPALMAN